LTARTYREPVAWQRAMALATSACALAWTMPTAEQLGLASLMRRSAVSVPSNVAEGFGRENRSDFLRFLRTAPVCLSLRDFVTERLRDLPTS
jgi:S23 ribosomal protein.